MEPGGDGGAAAVGASWLAATMHHVSTPAPVMLEQLAPRADGASFDQAWPAALRVALVPLELPS